MEEKTKNHVLTINGGSSSIRFAFYKIDESLALISSGKLENIGIESSKPIFTVNGSSRSNIAEITDNTYLIAASFLVAWLENQDEFSKVYAIGHRIVFGMSHTNAQRITAELIDDLKKISAYDPEHLPEEIKLIDLFRDRHPAMNQIACFDTAFHTTMPDVAKRIAIPRRFSKKGVERYGFHGLSYGYLMQEVELLAGNEVAHGRIILAHLGNGASLAAVKDGKSIDTSMGFTPGSGFAMGSRCGDLDPGVAWYMMEFEKLNAQQFNHLVNHESGLLGISETSSDMRELMKSESTDFRAAEAIDLFCYQVKKWIGSFSAVLGGIETLVFSGGIGENIPRIRSQICNGLDFLGIELEETQNQKNEFVISTEKGKVRVLVIATNEELMIARLVVQVLSHPIKK